jgi:putative endonuclease
LYIGVTSDLRKRMAQHTQGLIEGFTKKYAVKHLVYYEMHELIPNAIEREKQLKQWQRVWKIRLIESMNPEWRDLFDKATGELCFGSADTEATAELISHVSGPRPPSG